jgi:ribosomal protein S18 acetylase RimI-like enzyme
MELTIRKYRQTDHERVMNLHIEGLRQHNASIGDPSMDKDMQNISSTYIENDGDFLVGMLGNMIVCMGAYRKRDYKTAEVKRIRVDSAYQRRGYGQDILVSLEKSARQKGYGRIILDTTTHQEPAILLFKKNGYQEYNRKKFGDINVVFFEKENIKIINSKNMR